MTEKWYNPKSKSKKLKTKKVLKPKKAKYVMWNRVTKTDKFEWIFLDEKGRTIAKRIAEPDIKPSKTIKKISPMEYYGMKKRLRKR